MSDYIMDIEIVFGGYPITNSRRVRVCGYNYTADYGLDSGALLSLK